MDDVMLGDMWAYAPDRLHLDNLRLAFCTWKHGYNINMLYSQCDDVSPMFLLVKTTSDTSGRVFGAYITEPLTKRHSTRGYFGSGESFVFSLDPHSQKFDWVGTEKMRVRALALAKGEFVSDDGDDINKAHSFFTQANNDMIMIGGGDSGHAILINSDLSEGSTNKNATYTNPPFVEQVQFHIADVEVWCLASDVGTIMQHAGEHTPVYNHGS
ncbi:hypothetical protein SARC_05129 [Sphaeroforma arctica JP610]|uniref:TLDc domain-containing protein n=1 Tax=Sphaeroforma arctica JP610 TaxID=667725 RepID=A0A0L0G343_9EUKA|nr:hypothetical protein SARC_05129 [Sphaeroforma arctica JP610]KNC82578.1 hypothetical protein SARC_05129 [Sphaeroforma arctica JP610]|eukprot:XP_014156480.1 hypothetical protein SARC_05129 [Sphaeroforma arctica JP610]